MHSPLVSNALVSAASRTLDLILRLTAAPPRTSPTRASVSRCQEGARVKGTWPRGTGSSRRKWCLECSASCTHRRLPLRPDPMPPPPASPKRSRVPRAHVLRTAGLGHEHVSGAAECGRADLVAAGGGASGRALLPLRLCLRPLCVLPRHLPPITPSPVSPAGASHDECPSRGLALGGARRPATAASQVLAQTQR